uniref:RING-type domain-containing protein n=1 Tax=Davidia involucrata TaxID=16924 RepID=A0A5B6Z3U7_DAVIN
MAIAGLHNVSVLDSSFLRNSQSPVSRPSTRASSLLQMWREIEGEHMVSHPEVTVVDGLRRRRNDGLNADLAGTYVSESQGSDNEDSLVDANEVQNGCGTWSQGQLDLQNEHEDSNSSISELSTDFGEVERERVRQIFREWMNSGIRDQGSNVSHMNNCSRAQLLGENERERVRIIREWVQTTSQQRGRSTCGGSREEQAAEIGAQIEQVRDGLIVNHCEIGSRRAIRRLCGRQALLDLLMRAERERQRELKGLLEHRPVSDFPHRNRIQSLLKGRFLRSDRSIRDERPTSMAASELGLLRQRNTVSNLREGFLSGLDNFVRGPAGSTQSDTSSNNGINNYRHEQIQTNSLQDCEQSEPGNGERDISVLCANVLEGSTSEDINWQGSNAQVEECQEQVLENEERNLQLPPNFELIERRAAMGEDVGGSGQGSIADEWSQETSGNEGEEQGHQSEALEVFQERSEPSSEESNAHGSSNHTDIYEGNLIENITWQDTSSQVDEWQESGIYEESDWQLLDNAEFSEWRNGTGEEGMDGNWGEITASDQWYQETSENEDGEQSHLQESHEVWHENGLQEAMDNWLEGPSGREAALVAPVGRATTSYFPDDDNEYSTEIRELLSRRSVSSLLRSGFRESLDQLIQSYVERQGHASSDWELDRTLPSPAFVEQDQEQQDQNEGQSDTVERTPLVLPSAPVTSSQPLWDQDLHDNWPRHNLHQHLGIEWEIINDLRIDMARLQQRMNNMQRMLEACMDMQLELQRSVRQEVSAALNRSADSTEGEGSLPMDGSKWDHVRKGICCLCCEGNIDSLLYRCGHMCTCSKCADKLVIGSGKCPMCRAPVVEVIRAYSSQ